MLYKVSCMNYFNFNQLPVSKFVFYNDDGVIYTSKRGWFDDDRSDILDIGEIVQRRKENFTRKENFAMTTTAEYFRNKKEYIIYVYVDGDNVKVTKETPYQRNMSETQIWTEQKIVIEMGGKTFTEIHVLKTEDSDFGKQVNQMMKELESENIKIDSYTLTKIMKKYNLNKIIEK